VCLTGPAGCGKTRLALEAARLWAGETRIAGPASAAAADVGPIIASALGLGYEAEDVVTAARMALAGRRLLLVADDCDHVTAAAAEQLTALVRAVPGLHVLATSRHPLGISEEQVLPVMPLACPVGSGQSHRRGRRSWKPATGRPCPRRLGYPQPATGRRRSCRCTANPVRGPGQRPASPCLHNLRGGRPRRRDRPDHHDLPAVTSSATISGPTAVGDSGRLAETPLPPWPVRYVSVTCLQLSQRNRTGARSRREACPVGEKLAYVRSRC
jgi:hypothetical protein